MAVTDKPAIDRLDLDQPLVKSWRLQWPVSAQGHPVEVALYIEPRQGIFYARVPETDDGALYAAYTRAELVSQVREALDAWVTEQAERQDGERQWERRIRIWYRGGRQVVGQPLTAEPTTANPSVDDRRADSPPWATCVEVGAVTYARYERARRPTDGWWDAREWAEDYDERLRRWTLQTTDKPKYLRDRAGRRPRRVYKTLRDEAVTRQKSSWGATSGLVRDVPWSEKTWADLHAFVARFQQLHEALDAFLGQGTEGQLLAALAGRRLLVDREAQ